MWTLVRQTQNLCSRRFPVIEWYLGCRRVPLSSSRMLVRLTLHIPSLPSLRSASHTSAGTTCWKEGPSVAGRKPGVRGQGSRFETRFCGYTVGLPW